MRQKRSRCRTSSISAAKLSPAVVNISTDEPDEPMEGAGPGPEAPAQSARMRIPSRRARRSVRRRLAPASSLPRTGYILTNQHVVENPGKVTVTLQDGHNYTAKVVGA